MRAYLLPGVTGLLLGLTLHWAGFSRADGLRDTLALRRRHATRSGLYTLGFAMALTALLCYLAVIDVDGIVVLPLSAGVLAGGAVFGVAAGLCGFTPVTAFAGLGGGHALEALSTVAGCALGTLALPALAEPLARLRELPPTSSATLFRMTLDEPFLLGGGFLGQGCAGALLMAIAACIPSNRRETPEPVPEEAAPEPQPVLLLPAAAPEEAFVALLPGEEPLVVDTVLDEAVPSRRRLRSAPGGLRGRTVSRRRNLRKEANAQEPDP